MTSGRLLDRRAIGGELRALAARPGLVGRQEELKELGLAISGTGDLDQWADLDLMQSFVRPESVRAAVRPRPEPRFWSWLEVALGGLVFVPLLVTWAGLMQATSAYQALIGADAAQAARPFLQLWQTGFEGRLAGWATFGDIALSATLFIALLLVFSVAHGVRRAGTERRETGAVQEAEELLAELAPVLTRAQLVLNERRRSSPQRFVAELTGAAETLERLGRQAADTQRDLSDAALVVERSVTGARERLAEVGAAVDPLRQAVDGIEKAVDGVGKAVRDSGEKLAGTVRDGAAATDDLVRRGGQQAADAADAVRRATERVGAELSDAGERVEDAVRDLAVAQRGFTTGAETVADVGGRLLEQLDGLAREVASMADRVTAAASAAAAAAARVDARDERRAPGPGALLVKTVSEPGPGAGGTRSRPSDPSDAPGTPGVSDTVADAVAVAVAVEQTLLELDEVPVRQAGR
ncbi:methyl-accepting chemotaxis protein [Streptomyces sp. BE303]|uniref:methyl-accepting chemotaxis protein n=1 Tax=Streptomyces sp. BE303 TaxID=3002528 RepID=UPI002E770710|nr:methyl-accepting chemotaxis protein [Streptomyces sp. BE303]MED7951731.1 methyl-accepting chemotaxis protein [Streptomyces sp. BE303]